jgi:predicted nucleic acid-binding protein
VTPVVRTFVDTNVLVYAHDLRDTTRRPIAQARLDRLWADRAGVVSAQVLQEFHNVATRKMKPPMSPRAARQIIATYSAWPVISPDAALIVAASVLSEQYPISFWDALIVEAARRAGAGRLLTEDLQGGRRLGGVLIENPFDGEVR